LSLIEVKSSSVAVGEIIGIFTSTNSFKVALTSLLKIGPRITLIAELFANSIFILLISSISFSVSRTTSPILSSRPRLNSDKANLIPSSISRDAVEVICPVELRCNGSITPMSIVDEFVTV